MFVINFSSNLVFYSMRFGVALVLPRNRLLVLRPFRAAVVPVADIVVEDTGTSYWNPFLVPFVCIPRTRSVPAFKTGRNSLLVYLLMRRGATMVKSTRGVFDPVELVEDN